MGNTTLEHLLEVEAEASAMVENAQKEADKRIRENEEKNRKAYEDRLKIELQKCELTLKEEKEKIKELYQKTLDEYRREIFGIKPDEQGFSALLNEYLKKG
ncbi:MAG: hypothetical protein FWD22_05000 [Treponema sp.]|nr:hypothetical protein [Treponema sp.]